MKCKKNCTERVHFISPPMTAYFSHAVINLPDGDEEHISITPPRKWHTKGNSIFCDDLPIGSLQSIYEKRYVGIDEKTGLKSYQTYLVEPEIVFGSGYTGIDKNDQYFKDIKKINKRVKEIWKVPTQKLLTTK